MARRLMFWAIFLFLSRNAAANERYTVTRGDTLVGIARQYDVSLKALLQANSLSKEQTLQPGQSLVIPSSHKSGKDAHGYTVKSGDTLSRIAKQLGVEARRLASANGIDKKKPLRIGQKLIVPGHDGSSPKDEAPTPENDASEKAPAPKETASNDGMQTLPIEMGLNAYYFEPQGPSRLSLRPVLMYLHGRSGNPQEDCKRWAKIVRRMGWLVCPMGPEDRGEGLRGWANNWVLGRQVVMSAVDALRKKYGRRVQLYGNTLIGFSEGAYVAMNIGVREARAFNRWLILGADSAYWGGDAIEQLHEQRQHVRRVYLITGALDQVENEIDSVKQSLRHAGVEVRTLTPKDMGHTLALEDKAAMYRDALIWLDRGKV